MAYKPRSHPSKISFTDQPWYPSTGAIDHIRVCRLRLGCIKASEWAAVVAFAPSPIQRESAFGVLEL